MTQQEYLAKIEEVKKEFNEKLQELYNINNPVPEQPKRWKPKDDEEYWGVDYNGLIFKDTWGDNGADNWCYLTGNCFKTKEEAEEHKKQIEYTARYKNYIEEHSEPLDWSGKGKKYYARFDCFTNEIEVDWYSVLKHQGVIYASSVQIIWDAIEEIGEDNFKKYVLGVK